MSAVIIKVENLSKKYTLGTIGSDTLAEDVGRWMAKIKGKRPSTSEDQNTPIENKYHWALKNVNFEIQQGDTVGIIGKNGAGKSTLLKILSRITSQSSGIVKVKGRIASLLEVGTGFHRELSGKENIFLNGAILGMRKAEIKKKFDEIVAFSGVEKYLDTPVKRYSSGMYVRLAFAVAAHLDPEILIVDEVLAVGDAEFQKKCLNKMQDVAGSGRTILFVSHNMAAIQHLCKSAILLKDGQTDMVGATSAIIEKYMEINESFAEESIDSRSDRRGNGETKITNIRFLSGFNGKPLSSIVSGQDIMIEVSYTSLHNRVLNKVDVGLSVYTGNEQFLTVLNSQMANKSFDNLPSEGKVFCKLDKFPLMPGSYTLWFALHVGNLLTDRVRYAKKFSVEEGDYYGTGITNSFGRQGVYVTQSWNSDIDNTIPILELKSQPF